MLDPKDDKTFFRLLTLLFVAKLPNSETFSAVAHARVVFDQEKKEGK